MYIQKRFLWHLSRLSRWFYDTFLDQHGTLEKLNYQRFYGRIVHTRNPSSSDDIFTAVGIFSTSYNQSSWSILRGRVVRPYAGSSSSSVKLPGTNVCTPTIIREIPTRWHCAQAWAILTLKSDTGNMIIFSLGDSHRCWKYWDVWRAVCVGNA